MTNARKLQGIAGAVLLAAIGAALASNMTFKVVPDIPTGDPEVYDIALPWNNNYVKLSDVFNDISASPGCTAASVALFNPDQSSCTWTGAFTCDTAIPHGAGVRVTTAGPCNGWVIVGAHDPVTPFHFATADPEVYDVSAPYHTTAMLLSDLFDEIPNVASVTIFYPDQASCTWAGPFCCNATIPPFHGVRVTVNPGGSNWVPSHY